MSVSHEKERFARRGDQIGRIWRQMGGYFGLGSCRAVAFSPMKKFSATNVRQDYVALGGLEDRDPGKSLLKERNRFHVKYIVDLISLSLFHPRCDDLLSSRISNIRLEAGFSYAAERHHFAVAVLVADVSFLAALPDKVLSLSCCPTPPPPARIPLPSETAFMREVETFYGCLRGLRIEKKATRDSPPLRGNKGQRPPTGTSGSSILFWHWFPIVIAVVHERPKREFSLKLSM